MLRISRSFQFDAAHALKDYNGPCRNIHGHRYRLEVTIRQVSTTNEASEYDGILMDFKQLKKIVHACIIDPLDHALILSKPYAEQIRKAYDGIIYEMEDEPTAENMIHHFLEQLQAQMPSGIVVSKIRLHETENCFAEWEESLYEQI